MYPGYKPGMSQGEHVEVGATIFLKYDSRRAVEQKHPFFQYPFKISSHFIVKINKKGMIVVVKYSFFEN